jgi:hypothetical protein
VTVVEHLRRVPPEFSHTTCCYEGNRVCGTREPV